MHCTKKISAIKAFYFRGGKVTSQKFTPHSTPCIYYSINKYFNMNCPSQISSAILVEIELFEMKFIFWRHVSLIFRRGRFTSFECGLTPVDGFVPWRFYGSFETMGYFSWRGKWCWEKGRGILKRRMNSNLRLTMLEVSSWPIFFRSSKLDASFAM